MTSGFVALVGMTLWTIVFQVDTRFSAFLSLSVRPVRLMLRPVKRNNLRISSSFRAIILGTVTLSRSVRYYIGHPISCEWPVKAGNFPTSTPRQESVHRLERAC